MWGVGCRLNWQGGRGARGAAWLDAGCWRERVCVCAIPTLRWFFFFWTRPSDESQTDTWRLEKRDRVGDHDVSHRCPRKIVNPTQSKTDVYGHTTGKAPVPVPLTEVKPSQAF